MQPETKAKIEETVREILGKSDMSEMTEYHIQKQASDWLGLDHSQPEYKAFVRRTVNSFLGVHGFILWSSSPFDGGSRFDVGGGCRSSSGVRRRRNA
ncbi:hypothetical protein Ddye_014499 [Dipteronia dyeriana]|uniref:DEK-C domain-containing protein n=1 Tax=Dipteronia dyeriana TaxID=168575 RepID=A0AAE0CL79_9ROSI|nr:hypothetical protein Ddye_014499 [Dipteronia dyeriana]